MMTDERPLLHVVAGIVYNRAGEFLLTSRPPGKAYAGYWEFAGGKVEAGESGLAALQREFEEELGIRITRATPWLCKIHSYEHARVHLRFFRVPADGWQGELQAREGQQWAWQRAGAYTVSPMLPANSTLLKALSVPDTLFGNLSRGFDDGAGYRVVPYARHETGHRHVLLTRQDLDRIGRLPAADSIWMAVRSSAEWLQAQDADVVVWQVNGSQAAAELTRILTAGVAMPVVVLADPATAHSQRAHWLALGAHAVVADDEQAVC